MRTILVTGGRTFGCTPDQRRFIRETLDRLHAEERICCLVHGGATGADTRARDWAKAKFIPERGYSAEWERIDHPNARIVTRRDGSQYDANAGCTRNRHMLDRHPEIALVVAFPGGTGTKNMMLQAERRGLKVEQFHPCKGHPTG